MHRLPRPNTAFSLDKPKRETRGRDRVVLNKHRLWIKSQPSIVNGSLIDVDPHHVKRADHSVGKPSDSGGKRVDDTYLVPICRDLHDELHDMTEKKFEVKYGIDLVKLALGFFTHSGDDHAARTSINWTIMRAREVERANAK